jgi:hypothetical protein
MHSQEQIPPVQSQSSLLADESSDPLTESSTAIQLQTPVQGVGGELPDVESEADESEASLGGSDVDGSEAEGSESDCESLSDLESLPLFDWLDESSLDEALLDESLLDESSLDESDEESSDEESLDDSLPQQT